MISIWDSLPDGLTKNCFFHTKLFGEKNITLERDEDTLNDINLALEQIVEPENRMNLEFLLRPDGEDDVHEVLDDDGLVASAISEVTGIISTATEDSDDESSSEDEEPWIDSVKPETRRFAVVVVKELLERKGMLDEKLQAALRGVESDERRNEIKGMRQSTLDEFFHPPVYT